MPSHNVLPFTINNLVLVFFFEDSPHYSRALQCMLVHTRIITMAFIHIHKKFFFSFIYLDRGNTITTHLNI